VKVYIVGAKRTPIGRFGGVFKDLSAVELAKIAAKAALEQAGISPEAVDQVVVGNVLMAGQGMGPARQVALGVHVPVEKTAFTVNMVCGSGMKAIMLAAQAIMLGEAHVVLAAGMENMSKAPYLLPSSARFGAKFGNLKLLDSMIEDGLTDVFNQIHMGLTAEHLAEKFGISRQDQDLFAYQSQMKTKEAMEKGKFRDEIVPVPVKVKKEEIMVDKDEHPRPDVTLEKLSKLPPAFKKDGTVTAGNSSGINDGASATVLVSEDFLNAHGLKPLIRIVDFAKAGVDPLEMGLGPVPAVKKLMEKTGKSFQEMELIELNEAFAAQSIAVIKNWSELFGISTDEILNKTNVNGGAIALGHPIGASGNRIVVTLIYEMKKREATLGLATLCIGGGMGTAIMLENVS